MKMFARIILVIFLFSLLLDVPVYAEEDSVDNTTPTVSREELKRRVEEKKQQLMERMQERKTEMQDTLLEKHRTLLVRYIESAKERLVHAFSDEALLSSLQSEVSLELDNLKVQAEAAATSEELREIRTKVTELWRKVISHRFVWGLLVSLHRHELFIDKLAGYSDRLTEKAQTLSSEDQTALLEALTEFDAALVSAQSKITQAKALLVGLTLDSDHAAILESARQLKNAAKTELMQALQTLKVTLTGIRNEE